MITGPSGPTSTFAARCAMSHSPTVQRHDLAPGRIEEVVVDLFGCELVEPATVDILERECDRSVGE